MRPGPPWRTGALARMRDEVFDVLVIGGGATGAATARDAALRGLHVALCEHGDFASQTSSQSSKLIHGGLRYLQYGNLGLVFEALAERHRLMRAAPHLCRPLEFVYPAYRGRAPSLLTLWVGVTMYDALALWRTPMKSRRVRAGTVHELVPLLRDDDLIGAELYTDCQTDDARLVLETLLDAEDSGAVVASYVHVADLGLSRPGHLRVVTAVDRESGETFEVRARAIVNATGPFSDTLSRGRAMLRPTLGVHVVFDSARLPTDGRAVVIHSPRDGRLMFTLPWGARTIVGTTDTDWRPPGEARAPRPSDDIRPRGADVDYLLEAVNHNFPQARLGRDDVVSAFAGLRPLIASHDATPSATSREHEIWVDRHGLLHVAGGKLTTMRRMGEETVDRVVELLRARGVDRPLARRATRERPLPGGTGQPDLAAHELATDVEARLRSAYGARARNVLALTRADEGWSRRLVPDLPYLRAEVLFAARHDHVCEVEDVLRRRVPLFRDARDQGLSAAGDVADVLAAEFGWSAERRARSVEAYNSAVALSRQWRSE